MGGWVCPSLPPPVLLRSGAKDDDDLLLAGASQHTNTRKKEGNGRATARGSCGGDGPPSLAGLGGPGPPGPPGPIFSTLRICLVKHCVTAPARSEAVCAVGRYVGHPFSPVQLAASFARPARYVETTRAGGGRPAPRPRGTATATSSGRVWRRPTRRMCRAGSFASPFSPSSSCSPTPPGSPQTMGHDPPSAGLPAHPSIARPSVHSSSPPPSPAQPGRRPCPPPVAALQQSQATHTRPANAVHVVPSADWLAPGDSSESRLHAGSSQCPPVRSTYRDGAFGSSVSPESSWHVTVPAPPRPPLRQTRCAYRRRTAGSGGEARMGMSVGDMEPPGRTMLR